MNTGKIPMYIYVYICIYMYIYVYICIYTGNCYTPQGFCLLKGHRSSMKIGKIPMSFVQIPDEYSKKAL